jgi:hypothetical protein
VRQRYAIDCVLEMWEKLLQPAYGEMGRDLQPRHLAIVNLFREVAD